MSSPSTGAAIRKGPLHTPEQAEQLRDLNGWYQSARENLVRRYRLERDDLADLYRHRRDEILEEAAA